MGLDEPTDDAKDDEEARALVGRTVADRFHVDAVLGIGGMGIAYRASDRKMGRTVVLKTPRKAFLSDASRVAQFNDEMAKLAKLEDPNIVQIYDTGVWEGIPYLILKHLGGGSLWSRLKKEPRQSPREVLAWLLPMARALDFLRGKGVVHRDVKPSNILFDDANRAFLADFGIATAAKDPAATGTDRGLRPGSALYMPPEAREGVFTPAYDQYSLAVIVYQALAGVLPHTGGTTWEILFNKKTKSPSPLNEQAGCEDLPPETCDAIGRALAPNLGDRHPTCMSFVESYAAPFRKKGVRGFTDADRRAATGERSPPPKDSTEEYQEHRSDSVDGGWEPTDRIGRPVEAKRSSRPVERDGDSTDPGLQVRPTVVVRRPKKQKSKALQYVALVAALIGAVVVGLVAKDMLTEGPGLQITSPSPGGAFHTSDAQLIVSGKSAPGGRVRVDGKEAPVDADGSFRATVELKDDGMRRIPVAARTAGGDVQSVELKVVVDRKAPTLKIESPRYDSIQVGEPTFEVSGWAEDENIDGVYAGDERVELTTGGRFQFRVNIPAGGTVVRLVARDKARNHDDRTITFTTPGGKRPGGAKSLISNLSPSPGTSHFTNRDTLEISGRVSSAGSRVVISRDGGESQTPKVDPNGNFTAEYRTSRDGPNQITVTAEDPSGARDEVPLNIIRDTTIPKLELDDAESGGPRRLGETWRVRESTPTLGGYVRESRPGKLDYAIRLTVSAPDGILDPKYAVQDIQQIGRFDIPLRLPVDRDVEIVLVAEDKAHNRSSPPLRIRVRFSK